MYEINDLDEFKTLKLGDKIYWKNEKKGYTIKAKDERYIIVTKKLFGKLYYSILDLEKGICSTNDYVFNPYDYDNQEEIDKSLIDLNKEEYHLSKRYRACILQVIDRYKIA
ncbi:hypothetical protein [Clostridium beijerinckii]|uniref:hypothetical protein n=1 Tax=Clostridium beijerinckii TaxID=1520 RepID=UPI00156E44C6|nr:hypothetical protein [Clostridium beijerinckii]NRU52494.1 hypothetical protein [Clostridium beijerinckii]NYC69061.1 hypothetical protein [Clostridium beijerinckii]NYC91695.1 hypothetical protein [Clostridium beijerinckii]